MLLALFVRARGALLRGLALIALALALLNPVIRHEDREPLSDVAVLVVDKSLSQAIGNRSERTDDAVKKISDAVSELRQTEIAYRHRAVGRRQATGGHARLRSLEFRLGRHSA